MHLGIKHDFEMNFLHSSGRDHLFFLGEVRPRFFHLTSANAVSSAELGVYHNPFPCHHPTCLSGWYFCRRDHAMDSAIWDHSPGVPAVTLLSSAEVMNARESMSWSPTVVTKEGAVYASYMSSRRFTSDTKGYTRASQMKTLNIFYLVIYWTQKVHNDFIFRTVYWSRTHIQMCSYFIHCYTAIFLHNGFNCCNGLWCHYSVCLTRSRRVCYRTDAVHELPSPLVHLL